jgi:hypothetical protein
MCFYPEHVKDILNTLMEAKIGEKIDIKREDKELFEE